MIQCYYQGQNGEEDFDLGVLIRTSTTLLNQCDLAAH